MYVHVCGHALGHVYECLMCMVEFRGTLIVDKINTRNKLLKQFLVDL